MARKTRRPKKAPKPAAEPSGSDVPVTFWQHYRRRFWTTQLFVALLLAIGYWGVKLPPSQLLAVFVAMQVGGLIGAWLATRIHKSVRNDDLPLSRR